MVPCAVMIFFMMNMSEMTMTTENLRLEWVRPASVRPDPGQPRRHFDAAGLMELADSIAELGLQQPPKVFLDARKGDFVIVAGERRWRACSMIVGGYGERAPVPDYVMPVLVADGLEGLALLKAQMVENLQRSDMLPSEEAAGYERMEQEYGVSRREISRMLGIPHSRVFRKLALARLPLAWRDRLDRGEIRDYVAELALAIPPECVPVVAGRSVLEDALEVAAGARNREEARFLLDRRYSRPFREARMWANGEMVRERQEFFERWSGTYLEGVPEGVEVLDYERCRLIYPFDEERLLPMNSRGFASGEAFPEGSLDGLAPGREADVCWGELAVRYGAPLYLACDGKMALRVLVFKDYVREAARTAAADDPAGCLFAVPGAGGRSQQESARAQKGVDARTGLERMAVAGRMLRGLDAAVRRAHESGEPPGPLFYEAAFFVAQLGALGFDGRDNVMIQVLEVGGWGLGKEQIFSTWAGLLDDGLLAVESPAVVSLLLCAWLMYYIGQESSELMANEVWLELAGAYGVELEGGGV